MHFQYYSKHQYIKSTVSSSYQVVPDIDLDTFILYIVCIQCILYRLTPGEGSAKHNQLINPLGYYPE